MVGQLCYDLKRNIFSKLSLHALLMLSLASKHLLPQIIWWELIRKDMPEWDAGSIESLWKIKYFRYRNYYKINRRSLWNPKLSCDDLEQGFYDMGICILEALESPDEKVFKFFANKIFELDLNKRWDILCKAACLGNITRFQIIFDLIIKDQIRESVGWEAVRKRVPTHFRDKFLYNAILGEHPRICYLAVALSRCNGNYYKKWLNVNTIEFNIHAIPDFFPNFEILIKACLKPSHIKILELLIKTHPYNNLIKYCVYGVQLGLIRHVALFGSKEVYNFYLQKFPLTTLSVANLQAELNFNNYSEIIPQEANVIRYNLLMTTLSELVGQPVKTIEISINYRLLTRSKLLSIESIKSHPNLSKYCLNVITISAAETGQTHFVLQLLKIINDQYLYEQSRKAAKDNGYHYLAERIYQLRDKRN